MSSRVVSVESPGMRRVREVLGAATAPLDAKTIATLACVSVKTFNRTYRQLLLRADPPLMHVAAYRRREKGSGTHIPLYASGPRKCKPPKKPDPIPPVIAQRVWRNRTGYYETIKAQRRLARPPDPALAALLGLKPLYHKTPTTPARPAERNAAP